MEHLTMEQGRRMAESWLDDHLQDALQPHAGAVPHAALSVLPEERRRLTQTLYARQKNSLEYLSLIRLETDEKPRREAVPLSRGMALLGHPLVALLLSAATAALLIAEYRLPAAAAAILLCMQSLLRATHPGFRRRGDELPEVHEPYLAEDELARFLQRQTDRIALDVSSILDRQNVTLDRERHDVGEDAVELYCALREAALDVPDPETLAYPLSIVKMSLMERGLEPIEYSPETAIHFDVMPADCEAQMRYPAIRERERNVVIRRGLYLRPKM